MSDRERRQEEARRLSQMLIHITENAKTDFAMIVETYGVPVHLARAILALNIPAPMRQLADQLACDRSYITNLADQLHERGLVTRVPDGVDRRVKLLQLTPLGKALRRQITEAVAERALVMRRLTAAERKTLAPLLEKLLDGE